MQRMMTAAFGLGLAVMVAGCGSGEQVDPDQQVEERPE